MFKNIQKYLLINHPLLWNLKVVPVTFYLIIFHILFFVLGYANGAINFIETADNYDYNSNQDVIISLGVFISIISFILWAVFYFKNNSLKSFYPKTKFSLFKEWLLILLITFLLTSFTISFFYGKDMRVRSYFTEAEAKRRCEILSQGSMFVEGSYSEHYNTKDGNYAYENTVSVATNGIVTVDSVKTEDEKDYFYYKGVIYSNYSLLNKNINSYSFFNYENDSLRKMKLKDWMANNQKEQIRTLFKNYLAIAEEHNLKANIDENKWLDLVYNYPAFTEYKIIGGEEKSIFYDINNENVVNAIDTTSQYIKKIGNYDYLVNRFYVPEKALNYSYNKIADSWNKPLVNFETFLIVLYIAFCLSLVVFSFRVTSGKNWLIALVTAGVINIIVGIITAFTSSPYVYFGFQAAFFIGLLIYFFSRLYGKKGKGVSGITNNILLWMVTPFLPIVYGLGLESIKEISGYNDTDYIFRKKLYPRIEYLDDIVPHLLYLNLALVLIMMLFLSTKIKKWRGVAED